MNVKYNHSHSSETEFGMRWKSPRRGWDEGATAVETAITISLSLALVFGILEFGMALWQANTMALAVEEAGRHVMVNNGPLATLQAAPKPR